jgi:hypothetical protein
MANQTIPAIQVKDSNVGIGTATPGAKLVVSGSAVEAHISNGDTNTLTLGNFSGGRHFIKSINLGVALTPLTLQASSFTFDTGNVGIGTTSPSYKLDVVSSGTQIADFRSTVTDGLSNIRVVNDQQTTASGTSPAAIELVGKRGSSTHGRHAWIGAEGVDGTTFRTQIKFKVRPEDSPYQWSTLPTQMVIDGNGNVGIGTASPNEKLQVTSGDISIRSSSGAWGSLRFGTTNSSYLTEWAGIESDWEGVGVNVANLKFYTSYGSIGERMRITSGGNVGIGTTSPNIGGRAGYGTLTVRNNSTFGEIEIAGNTSTTGAVLSFYGDTTKYAEMTGEYQSSTNGMMIFRTRTSGTVSEKMRITSAGNVGIGTTSPVSALSVVGKTNLGNQASGFYVTPSTLHIASSTVSQISFEDYVVTAAIAIAGDTFAFGHQNASPSYEFKHSNTYNGNYATTGTTFARFNPTTSYISAGNVGIGTTSPSYKLQVAGNAAFGTNSGGLRIDSFDGDTGVISPTVANGSILITDDSRLQSRGTEFLNGGGVIMKSLATFPPLDVQVDTTRALYIDGTGRVGINNAAPSERLHVDGNVIVTYNNSFQGINSIGNKAILARVSPTTGIINYAEYATATNLNGFVLGSDDARVKGDIATDSLDFITNTSSRMFINSSGNVGIGTTSPSYLFVVRNSIGTTVNIGGGNSNTVPAISIQSDSTTWASSQNGFAYYYNATNGNLDLYRKDNSATENQVMTWVRASGNVGIATASPSYKLDVVGDSRITSGSLGVGVAPNATDGRIDASNDIVAYSTSDQRLKENVTPIENALEKVKTLTGVEFDWKEETAHVHGYHGHDVGIIAQDVQAVLPEAVRTNDSGYLSVRYEKMIALLIEGMKEQQNQIDELKKLIK